MPQSLTQRARNAYADTLVAEDSRMANTAHSIRSGTYSNVWIGVAVVALEEALRLIPAGDELEDE